MTNDKRIGGLQSEFISGLQVIRNPLG